MQMEPLSQGPEWGPRKKKAKKLALSRETLQILDASPYENWYDGGTKNGLCDSLSCREQCTGADSVCLCRSDASCGDTCHTGPYTVCF